VANRIECITSVTHAVVLRKAGPMPSTKLFSKRESGSFVSGSNAADADRSLIV